VSIVQVAEDARAAWLKLSSAGADLKNQALAAIAEALKDGCGRLIEANDKDLAKAEQESLAAPLLKRLKMDEAKISECVAGIEDLIKLAEPVGEIMESVQLDEGLDLYKVSCPIGVIGVIFESRPDALVQISALCLKSGNAVLLKGGSEAENTNIALVEIISQASVKAGMPANWLQLLRTRQDVAEMLKLDRYIDLMIPRGSKEFVRYIMDNTRIAVLGHSDGICHLYVDSQANLDMAVDIAVDSKCQYVAVCNAMETLLVHRGVAKKFLPMVKSVLEDKGVEIRGCQETVKIIQAKPATEEDWLTEYLDYILSVKVVESLDEAVEHINRFGSGHTDAIVTENKPSAAKFMEMVGSANVFCNCSTRFSDGYRYGLGAEVGISTNKIHARGPVGLEGLLIYKWKLIGSGQVVAPYANGERKFTHNRPARRLEPGIE